MPYSMVSRSRISPIRMTSGACRRVFFSGDAPGVGVHADLALGDHAVLVRVHVLDRVLDGDDVALGVLVAVAEHRGEGGGLAAAGAADDQHQAALGHRHVLQDRRQLELLEGRDRGVDGAHHGAAVALLDEGADAEAADARRRNGEVALLGRVVFLGLPVVHDRADQRGALLRGERLVVHRRDPAVDLDRRREAGGEEQVGAVELDHLAQQLVDKSDCLVAFH
jgi:hypothetical protein